MPETLSEVEDQDVGIDAWWHKQQILQFSFDSLPGC